MKQRGCVKTAIIHIMSALQWRFQKRRNYPVLVFQCNLSYFKKHTWHLVQASMKVKSCLPFKETFKDWSNTEMRMILFTSLGFPWANNPAKVYSHHGTNIELQHVCCRLLPVLSIFGIPVPLFTHEGIDSTLPTQRWKNHYLININFLEFTLKDLKPKIQHDHSHPLKVYVTLPDMIRMW